MSIPILGMVRTVIGYAFATLRNVLGLALPGNRHPCDQDGWTQGILVLPVFCRRQASAQHQGADHNRPVYALQAR
jgi:hypothetical protein